jgi:hypothetical protein
MATALSFYSVLRLPIADGNVIPAHTAIQLYIHVPAAVNLTLFAICDSLFAGLQTAPPSQATMADLTCGMCFSEKMLSLRKWVLAVESALSIYLKSHVLVNQIGQHFACMIRGSERLWFRAITHK